MTNVCGSRRDYPQATSLTIGGSSVPEGTDPAAVVLGLTGVSLSTGGSLYVAISVDNRIAAIPNAVLRTSSAGTGITVTKNGSVEDPLGLTIGQVGLLR